jgi:hypothetical protein
MNIQGANQSVEMLEGGEFHVLALEGEQHTALGRVMFGCHVLRPDLLGRRVRGGVRMVNFVKVN